MPTAQTLERFIARVEQNAHAEAIEEFYTADSSMQENQSTPRVGRDANVEPRRSESNQTRTAGEGRTPWIHLNLLSSIWLLVYTKIGENHGQRLA